MTDRRDQAAPRRSASASRPALVAYGGAAVTFAAVLAGLGWQVASGADPAIGEAEPAAAPPAERVVVRRIVRRVIVTGDEPRAAGAAPAGDEPAVQPAAPAPEPAAPAPAPTTRAS